MAPGAEYSPDPPGNHAGEPAKGMVAMRRGPYLEGGSLFQNGHTKVQLPGVRRPGANESFAL